MKANTAILISSHQGPSSSPNGATQPPKNSVAAIADTVRRFTYSAMKYSAKRKPLYSVWYPATSSCSASGKSNGARFVSAIAAVKYSRKPSGCSSTYQTELFCCRTISLTDIVPLTSTTPTSARPSASSYETTCAPPRSEPNSEYFEP